jgi:hypothetical protein
MMEANFEIAFSLIDLAQTNPGDHAWAAHAVSNAEDVLHDIERRLALQEPDDRTPFVPLLEELKRQLAHAKCRA